MGLMPSHRRWSVTYMMSLCVTVLAAGFGVLMAGLFFFQSLPVWRHSGPSYITGIRWFYRKGEFGIAPMIYGTAVVSVIALFLAAPAGIGAAIFVAEFLPGRLRLLAKLLVELLAGVPSVVYGLLGILFLRDWVYRMLASFDPLSGDTLLTAGILLAVMILPTVITLSDDAFRGVSQTQRLAARGLGLNRTETVLSVSIPQAWPGITATLLLSLGRALGETIAVFLVVGRQDNQWPNHVLSPQAWIAAGQTLTSKLGGSETNIAYGDPLHWGAICGLGLILLGLAALVTFLGGWLAQRSSAERKEA